jgi:nucleoside-diphosphate-sugar epimerase
MYLITGASGFIGKGILQQLHEAEKVVVAAIRRLPTGFDPKKVDVGDRVRWQVVGDINSQTDWLPALQGVHAVVHCAARVHATDTDVVSAMVAYREVNVLGTLRLAEQAASVGVQRFVFLSSIGVNGNLSEKPFTEDMTPQPHDAYSISKLEAEQALFSLAARTKMEVVVVRPPLVYGPGASGNFGSLIRWVLYGIPLPLGSVHNRRSLVALENLVSLVLLCADRDRSPQAANQVFLVADGEDVSTSTLLRKVARTANRSCCLLPVPTWVLRAMAILLGKRSVADRLLGNLEVDANKARALLDWHPVVCMDEQLSKIFKQGD